MQRSMLALPTMLLVPVAVLACSKPAPKAAPPAAAAPAESAQAMPPAPPPPVNVTLAAKNKSGITGSATVETKGDSTVVTLTLQGGRAGRTYPAHIHMGECAKPGAVVVPLTSVKVGKDKSGTSTTTVPTAKLQGQSALLIQAHQPTGTPAACGDVPQH
jgi:hypothetical protein